MIKSNDLWQVILIGNYCTGLTECCVNVRHGLLFQHKHTGRVLEHINEMFGWNFKEADKEITKKSRNTTEILY